MRSLLIVAVALGAAAASPAMARAQDGAGPVGVVEDACSHMPPMPTIVADYLARAERLQAAGQTPPTPSTEGMAIYNAWRRELLVADYPGLCRYRAANRELPPSTARRIVFLGDSITEGWSAADAGYFARERINRGISGQTSAQMLGRFRADAIALDPAVVHILAGANDIAGNTGPTDLDTIEDNIRSMVELARAHGIAVVIGAVLPARRFNWRPEIDPAGSIRELNERLRAYAALEGICFADYYAVLHDGDGGIAPNNAADGVHPTAAGYALMAPVAERALVQAQRVRRRQSARCGGV